MFWHSHVRNLKVSAVTIELLSENKLSEMTCNMNQNSNMVKCHKVHFKALYRCKK